MGDPCIVANVVEAFYPQVLRWSLWHWRNDPTGKVLAATWGPCKADLSLSKYAGDLWKFALAPHVLIFDGLMAKRSHSRVRFRWAV